MDRAGRQQGGGLGSVAFGLPPIYYNRQIDDYLSLRGQNGNLGQISGYRGELAGHVPAGFYCAMKFDCLWIRLIL